MWCPRELTTEQRTKVSLRLSSRFAVLGAFGPSPFGQMTLCPQMYMIQSYQLNRVPNPSSVVHTGTTTQHLPEISLRLSWLLRSIVSEPSAQIFLEGSISLENRQNTQTFAF